jgi:hypothetical protein
MKENIKDKIPSNVIIKTSYEYTKKLLESNYFNSVIEQIMNNIKEHPKKL